MKYFDAHTHVQFVAYNDDREATIQRAKDAGVVMNVVGTQKDTSTTAVELAEKYDHIYASVGLHPIHTSKSYHDAKEFGSDGKAFTSRSEHFDISKYRPLAENLRTIAIGECGLDYYRLEADTKKLQERTFIEQIELANAVGKPLMLHIRDAYDDALTILKAHANVQGDVHFFAGDWATARKFLDIGFALSFTGVITFTHDYDEVVQNAPLDMLLSETDAPYITPVPHRGKRNESSNIPLIVARIAQIRGEDLEKVRDQLFTNTRRVFNF
ncbi:MAG TPA: TatD family hydrolase [Candidatus Paceibacterota bacterium]